MQKYLVDFITKDGEMECGIVNADDLDAAAEHAHRLVEKNNGTVTNVMLWSDAVLATIDPDDYTEKGER